MLRAGNSLFNSPRKSRSSRSSRVNASHARGHEREARSIARRGAVAGRVGTRRVRSADWFGVAAPARTPPAIVSRLNAAIVKSLQLPGVREKLTSEGSEIVGNSPPEFATFLKRDIARWAQVIKDSGVKL